MKKELLESIKEFARIMISGLVPVITMLIAFIVSGINTETGVIAIKWPIIYSLGLVQILTLISTALTKAWDKYTFEKNKIKGEIKGIIPF